MMTTRVRAAARTIGTLLLVTASGARSVCASGTENDHGPALTSLHDVRRVSVSPTGPPVLELIPISTGFNAPIGIDHHHPTNRVVVTVNYSSGQPHNFELIDVDGVATQFSTVSGLTEEVKIATARDEGGGMSQGGFEAGTLFCGSGVPGTIVRVSPDGTIAETAWVTLPGETGLLRGGLHIDRTGVFGGDLIVVTNHGGIWRVTADGTPTQVASVPGVHLEGVLTVPDVPARYGPWAGCVVTGAEDQNRVYAISAAGDVEFFEIGIAPEDIDLIPANENFFGVAYSQGIIVGAPACDFVDMIGDILVAQESPGLLYRVRWDAGAQAFETQLLAQVSQWEHVTFSPAGIVEVDPIGIEVQDRPFSFPLSPGQAILTFDRFDDQAGTRALQAVTIEVQADFGATATAENDADVPAPDFALNITGVLTVTLGDLQLLGLASETFATGGVAASDGVPGSGLDFFDFGSIAASITDSATQDGDLDAFVGAGTIDAVVPASAGFSVSGSTDSTVVIGEFSATGVVRLSYDFAVVCPGDVDGSGDVGFSDLLAVLTSWGPCAPPCAADLDGSGDVGFADLLAVLASWGPCC